MYKRELCGAPNLFSLRAHGFKQTYIKRIRILIDMCCVWCIDVWAARSFFIYIFFSYIKMYIHRCFIWIYEFMTWIIIIRKKNLNWRCHRSVYDGSYRWFVNYLFFMIVNWYFIWSTCNILLMKLIIIIDRHLVKCTCKMIVPYNVEL